MKNVVGIKEYCFPVFQSLRNQAVLGVEGGPSTCRKLYYIRYMKHAVAQLVEALRYKPEGRGFDSRCCHWNFSLT
jgi:hypothetical protein